MTTGYRIQSENHGVTDLLDPERQISLSYSGRDEDVRQGISVCASLEDLAAYIAQTGIEIDASNSVVVVVEGPESEDLPCDAHLGELLIHPTRVVSVTPADDTDIWDLVDAAYDRLYA